MAATIPLWWRSRTKALEFHLQRETLSLRDLAKQYKARPELGSVSLLSARLYVCPEEQSPFFQRLPAAAYESCFRELLFLRETLFTTNARCRTSLYCKQRDDGYRRHRSVRSVDRRNSMLAPSLAAAPSFAMGRSSRSRAVLRPPGSPHPRLKQ